MHYKVSLFLWECVTAKREAQGWVSVEEGGGTSGGRVPEEGKSVGRGEGNETGSMFYLPI